MVRGNILRERETERETERNIDETSMSWLPYAPGLASLYFLNNQFCTT